MHRIDLIAGARPNFMKIAPIIRALEARQSDGFRLSYRLVHTGQHYDVSMSGSFFEQLSIPEPDINLEVGSGTQAEQTAAIMTRYEKLLMDDPSELCLVVGDVTSTMACAITAQKLCIRVAHVEAGIRSGDRRMPEEINRMVTDAITDYFFTTSEYANENLRKAGIGEDKIFFVGNTMIDTLIAHRDRFQPPAFWVESGLRSGQYLVLTLHRPSNVDEKNLFMRVICAISEGVRDIPVVFPVHPRTAKVLHNMGTMPKNIYFVDPQPYLEFNYLVSNAKGVITDSGGITEETTVMGVPCMTLRDSTERPETVINGTNELLGCDPSEIGPALERLFSGQWKRGAIPHLWDGRAAFRIVDHLATIME